MKMLALTIAVVETGVLCVGVSSAAAAPFAYVANGSTLSVIDIADNSVSAVALPVGGSSRYVAVAPDGAHVYVTNQSFPSTVSVIDTATNEILVSPIAVGGDPSGIAVGPDGRFVYVANGFAGTVSVISTTTNAVVATIEVGSQLTGIAVTPDGSRVYVLDGGHGNVRVIDATTNTVGPSVSVDLNSHGIVISPDGSRVYVSHFNSSRVSVIGTASHRIEATITVGYFPLGMAVSPDGTRLYVADNDPALSNGSVAVVDTSTNTLLRRVTLPRSHGPRRLALTPDATRAYVTINNPTRVLAIDTAADQVVGDPVPLEEIPEGIAISTAPVGRVSTPTGLHARTIAGNRVTLRWTPPPTGLAPTDYVLEGGTRPGEVLATIRTGVTTPTITVTAPTGVFYLRIRALAEEQRSRASNEVRIHVNVALAPSAPANLLGVVDGSTLALAWTSTYFGGAPTSFALDVTGSVVVSLPLDASESIGFVGVPAGTYTVALRALNAAGSSPPSNAVTLTFPRPCPGPPLVPRDVLAYRVGRTVFLDWLAPAGGPAPTSYAAQVTGGWVGSVPTTARSLSGTVGPGAYTLSVVALNSCGTSAASAPQTVVVP